MTPKEAIKTLEIAKAEVEWNYPLDYAIAIDTAIEALEKQVAKKLKIYTDTRNYMDMYGNVTDIYEVDIYECPNCGAYITERFKDDTCELVPNYCNNCGQKFDWSEEE